MSKVTMVPGPDSEYTCFRGNLHGDRSYQGLKRCSCWQRLGQISLTGATVVLLLSELVEHILNKGHCEGSPHLESSGNPHEIKTEGGDKWTTFDLTGLLVMPQ